MLYLLATLQSYVVTTKDRFHRDDRGATAVEYGLLVGVMAVLLVVGLTTFGTKLGDFFAGLTDQLGITTP